MRAKCIHLAYTVIFFHGKNIIVYRKIYTLVNFFVWQNKNIFLGKNLFFKNYPVPAVPVPSAISLSTLILPAPSTVFYLCTSSLYGSNSNEIGSVHHQQG